MADLSNHLADLIRKDGPISIATYMAEALGHGENGYYMTRDPLGRTGDFTTAPEVSQIFGELIGLWCAHVWQTMGAPALLRLVELGPGRGTLMSDVLRAAHVVPAFEEAVDIHLVEVSPVLREAQRARLGNRPSWHRRFEDVPGGPMLLIANEFFDALPIRQFVRTQRGWYERCITLVGNDDGAANSRKDTSGPRFAFTLAPQPVSDIDIPAPLREASIGAIAETCPEGRGFAAQIGARLARDTGAALLIDYGHAQAAPGDTFQAVHKHGFHDPLEAPGTADLTAHVDFEALGTAARAAGAKAFGPVPQGAFLAALGIAERAERLRARATQGQREDIESGVHRLTAPDQMGMLFKALGLCHPALSELPGFASAP